MNIDEKEREKVFIIDLDEARILNQWLRLHHGLFKEQKGYIHLLRLINGLGNLVDKYENS